MLDPAIDSFLKEHDDLEKKLGLTNVSKDVLFSNWGQKLVELVEGYFCSHPVKFTHSTPVSKRSKDKDKLTSIVFWGNAEADGFLRSGNTYVSLDFSNYDNVGLSTKAFKFLNLKLSDGRAFIEHVRENSDLFKDICKQYKLDGHRLSKGLFPVEGNLSNKVTSERMKQVYFPVGNEYHLLSILTNSGILFGMKNRIDQIIESKTERENRRNKKFIEGGTFVIRNKTKIIYGGNQSQNVSVLNNQNGGVAYLLNSEPPELEARKVRLPKHDFFKDTLWRKSFNWAFSALEEILTEDEPNNMRIRNQRDAIFQASIFQTSEYIEQIRDMPSGWSDSDAYEALPLWQKTWLDLAYEEKRITCPEYLDLAMTGFSNWFLKSFQAYLNVTKNRFGDIELKHVIGLGEGFNPETEQQFKEAFR
ncbi:type I-F CRISPR-associated protein Csy1 [Thiomicrorhabdus sp.]|uniref:type I-F CRISPR-associated protein Csy1 n=1 Tax=Thiomicrorhabdus sp. TaxID=2039724 RepID=UPI0029C731E0|nr:type I-F CRISPR-associated protein Csy1 [Thiomicrorhabdus sp.]